MDLGDDNVMELLDWRPEDAAWRADWMILYERCPDNGWHRPAADWIDWARAVLGQPIDAYGHQAIAHLLYVAEQLHPQGIDRRRLQESLLALGQRHGQDYYPADAVVGMAEKNGIVRTEAIDLWRPGMVSGQGWRAFCRLTLYGKSLVKAETMPEIFAVPEPEPAAKIPPPAHNNWWEQLRALRAKQGIVAKAQPAAPQAREIPADFVWSAAFVDQQVRKFFRKHWDDYVAGVQAVINEQVDVEEFGRQFGPARISRWINQTLNVPDSHVNPCSSQNINGSATYGVLVKAFKRNPREHAVVKRLQEGCSDQAQAILDEFLLDGGGAA